MSLTLKPIDHPEHRFTWNSTLSPQINGNWGSFTIFIDNCPTRARYKLDGTDYFICVDDTWYRHPMVKPTEQSIEPFMGFRAEFVTDA
ncbi:hypothetical protein QUF64_01605 [Anaerolineales bacterium HSG6]|nr:hypothetical protein [Anaerolineales bacterium HSG6]